MNNENIDVVSVPEGEEYEVEKILAHKVIKSKNTKGFKYFIKWLNYNEEDNTWEKEKDVFAVDIIAQYWSNIPKNDKDRILFESLQAKKKNPIILSSPTPKVAKVISASSPSPPSSPSLQPTTTQKPSSISYFNGIKKNERVVSSSSSPIEVESSTLQQTKISDSFNTTLSSKKGKEKEDITEVEATDVRGVKRTFSEEEDDENKKRTRSGYTDYFTEQHKKKKKISESDEDEEHHLVEKNKESDTIIFDEALNNDPLRDWNELAVKVEYIGRELEGGPIYCAVKWVDDAVSLHSLDLVRTKRPDLVIDAFVESVYKQ